MKNQMLLLFLAVFATTIFIGCDALPKKDKETSDVEDMVETNTPPIEQNEIKKKTAIQRIKDYNDIFGSVTAQNPQGEGVYNYLGEANDPDGSVMAPRYFTINRKSFLDLVNYAKSKDKSIYASFGVTEEKYSGSNSKYSSVADLIFHFNKPNPDGSLNDAAGDEFYDHAQPCPVDCGSGTGDTGGGEITDALATSRIDAYNKIYDFKNEGNDAHYLKGMVEGAEKNILMPRYYKFKEIDLIDLLGDEDKDDYLYISMGAEQNTDDPNTYTSDLIFHHVRPNSQGYIVEKQPSVALAEAEEKEDEYYDVTVPCPHECN